MACTSGQRPCHEIEPSLTSGPQLFPRALRPYSRALWPVSCRARARTRSGFGLSCRRGRLRWAGRRGARSTCRSSSRASRRAKCALHKRLAPPKSVSLPRIRSCRRPSPRPTGTITDRRIVRNVNDFIRNCTTHQHHTHSPESVGGKDPGNLGAVLHFPRGFCMFSGTVKCKVLVQYLVNFA